MGKEQIVSDKEEIKKAGKLIKEGVQEKTAGGVLGTSDSSCPIVPLGATIFCKWNVKESKVMVSAEIAKEAGMTMMIDPYMTVIAVGGSIQSVKLGDKLLIKAGSESSIIPYQLEDGFKFHLLYEHAILGVIK